MSNLESSIARWRQQMLAGGIKTPVPLEELEIHLREEIAERIRGGWSEPAAFAESVREIGPAAALKSEFAKVGEKLAGRLSHLVNALAGIPNYQLAGNMNIANHHLEPRWATYVKSAVWIIPALFIWTASCVLVLPKLKEICVASGTAFPKPVLLALAVSEAVKNNFILGTLVVLAALILLEWRSRWWPRYRRMIFGTVAFSLNLAGLILVSTMMLFAVIAAANALQHAK